MIALSFGLTGCNNLIPQTGPVVDIGGNWQVSATGTGATSLPMLSGALNGSDGHLTGIFHANSASSCISPATPISVTGSGAAGQALTLSGPIAGGTLTLTGTVEPDGKSLTSATYSVTGGTCATATAVHANVQVYASIDGTYNGTFSDADGQVLSLVANLSQTPASDTDGNFQLSGTATLSNNPCFSSPASVSNSQVTGGSFNLTYTDATTNNSVNASGTFSTDGTTLTVTNWTLSGSCGTDSGTGTLTR